MKRRLGRILAGRGPIVAGPWCSEIGFELLYWIPFLTWATTRRPELANRLVVLSRGGAAHWYSHVSSRYVDVFDYFGREAYLDAIQRTAAAKKGKQKQFETSSFDLTLIERVKQTLALSEADLLHPSLMYQFFRETFKDDSVHHMRSISRYRQLPTPDANQLAGVLPDDYVAVRFYFNYSFPDSGDNREFVSSVLRNLTDKTNVVMLNTGMRLDDHWDYDLFDSQRLFRLDGVIKAANNLDIQTVAISRARAFVGTPTCHLS
jgi:hypothetical protein